MHIFCYYLISLPHFLLDFFTLDYRRHQTADPRAGGDADAGGGREEEESSHFRERGNQRSRRECHGNIHTCQYNIVHYSAGGTFLAFDFHINSM